MKAIDNVVDLRQRLDRWALPLAALGLTALAFQNWRAWQRDKAALAVRTDPVPLPPIETWPELPRVSALVAAWNEAHNIDRHIESFLALRYPWKQLVLCAGGRDGTYDRARQWADPQVKVLEQLPGEGKQGALRRCLAQASGDLVLLTDADCLFSDDVCLQLIEPIARGRAQVVTGVCEPTAGQRQNSLVQYQWFTDLTWSGRLPQKVDGVLGRNCALTMGSLKAIGGFDAAVATGTDYFMSRQLQKAGYQVQSVPGSRVVTEYPSSPGSYLRMWRRWNKNLLVHGLRFGARRDVGGVATASALWGAVLLLPLMTPLLGPVALAVPLTLFGAAVINRLRRLSIGAQLAGTGMSVKLLASIPLYALMDGLAALLAVRDALDRGRRSQW